LTTYPHFFAESTSYDADGPRDNQDGATASDAAAAGAPINNSTTGGNSGSAGKDSTKIETILIIATVPYTKDHATALWSHLECLTEGIDKVLLSAPNTPWSREVIAAVVNQFRQQQQQQQQQQEQNNGNNNHPTMPEIDAAFYTNNRYDVGLWCDGLTHHLGFDGAKFSEEKTQQHSNRRAIFLINDSSISLRQYQGLTDRIVKSSQIEEQMYNHGEGVNNSTTTSKTNVKAISLNGNLIIPGYENKHYWIESVYRGFTPRGIPTFFQHSCTPDAARACVGLQGNGKKQCIVNRYEMSLASSFSQPEEVDAMYPTYLPKEWDAASWMEENGGIGPTDQWIRGRRFFRYLHDVHDFPLRKVKWPQRYPHHPPKSHCMNRLPYESWLDKLAYPKEEVFVKFQEEMLKSESTL